MTEDTAFRPCGDEFLPLRRMKLPYCIGLKMEHALFVGITTKEALPVDWNVGAVGDTEVITRSTVHSCVCL